MTDVSSISIIRSKRKTLTLHVESSGQIVVRAPIRASDKTILQFIEKNSEWIEGQKIRVFVQKKNYKPSEKFWYLGQEVLLEIGNYKEIEVFENTLRFPEFLKFRIQKELHNWYTAQAKKIISHQVEVMSVKMETEYLHLTFSETKSRWGSCSPENALQFNWKLVMAPPAVINYVVIHELAHTKEKNHGMKFWQIVRYHSPAYRAHKNWLKTYGEKLII